MTAGRSDNPLGEGLWSFGEIGYLLRYLEGVTAGYAVRACPDDDNRFVLENIRGLLDDLNKYELGGEVELSGWVETLAVFADELDQYTEEAEFEMVSPDGISFFTKFSTNELNYATRWILHNSDQQVGAFVLPATCRPEGFLAAAESGTLLQLEAGQERTFTVITGKK